MTYPIVSIENAHIATVTIPNLIVTKQRDLETRLTTGGMNNHVSALMKEHRSNFLRFLQSRLKDRDEAEDVLQEFCVKVILKSDQIRDQASAIGWLRIVLKSVLADHFRRKTAEREALNLYTQEMQTLSEHGDHIEKIVRENEAEANCASCGCMKGLLPSLKAEYAEAVTLVDLEQMDRKQVALDIGITEKNLRVRLHRGRRALKKALEKACAHRSETSDRSYERTTDQG